MTKGSLKRELRSKYAIFGEFLEVIDSIAYQNQFEHQINVNIIQEKEKVQSMQDLIHLLHSQVNLENSERDFNQIVKRYMELRKKSLEKMKEKAILGIFQGATMFLEKLIQA